MNVASASLMFATLTADVSSCAPTSTVRVGVDADMQLAIANSGISTQKRHKFVNFRVLGEVMPKVRARPVPTTMSVF